MITSTLTPMMQQWAQAKEEHPDAILLFRMGDFYELFGDDAKIASNILDLTLTSRDREKNALKMAGFPFHAAENYITKLVDLGHKVAICEQLEDPKNKKGIVKRGIVEVVTPGTLITTDLASYAENYLLALVSNKEKFALASLDLASASFMVTHSFDEKAILMEISRLFAKEILVLENDKNSLSFLEKLDSKIRIEKRSQGDFSKKNHWSFSDIEDEEEKIALMLINSYVNKLQGQMPDYIKSPRRYLITEHLLLDESTRENIGIFSRKKGLIDNLFDVLNEAQTPMGKRALKESLSAPSTSLTEILLRQSLVEEFLDNFELRKVFLDKFKEICDLAKIVALSSSNKINPRALALLRDSLDIILELIDFAKIYNVNFINKEIDEIPKLEEVYQTLKNSLSDRPPVNIKDGHIFKAGFNAELDELYELSRGGENKLLAIEEREREITGISSLKVRYTRVFGYYIEVTKTHLDKVPSHYQRKQTIANGERYVTLELQELEVKLNNAKEAILLLEEKLFLELRMVVAANAEKLLKTAKIVGRLDMLNGLAQTASMGQYTKPEILPKEERRLSIVSGRHPVAELLCAKEHTQFIANDICLHSDDCLVALITGPNMAGKSTIMRQVALLQIMAQIGSFVPAKSASFSIVDAIFARVGASDDMASGRSTFMVEMSETAQILSSATSYSLILLDEIGRGTSTYDGMSIAQAVCEYIHDNICARTIFATHYHELTKLSKTLNKLINFHVKVDLVDDEIQFFYKLAKGAVGQSFGVEVAKLAGLPEILIARAKEVLSQMESTEQKTFLNILPQLNLFGLKEKKNDHDEVVEQIIKLDLNKITPLQALNKINAWQNYLRRL